MEQSPRASAPSPDRRSGLATGVAVLVAVAASVGAFTLWRELETLRATSAARDAELVRAAAEERAELKVLIDRNRRELDAVGARIAALDESVAGLKQRTEGGRSAWARAEVKHLLRVANDELHVAHQPHTALSALRAAAARLAELPDPALAPVRERLAAEIRALEALPAVDATGMALALLELEKRAARLPLKTRAPERYEPPSPAAPDAASGWDAFAARVKGVVGEFVSVRRRTAADEALLPPHEEYFLRRNLELKLATARAALLARDGAAFAAGVRAARDWIALYCDARDPLVRDAVADLAAMEKVELGARLPDISGSLELLARRWPDEAAAR